MRAAVRIPAFILLAAAAGASAQVERGDADAAGGGADSIGVSALDEQLVESGPEEDTEREPETGVGKERVAGWSFRWRLRGSSTLQESAAYARGEYAGGRSKLYQRVDVRRGGSFRLSALTEKDPGERNPADFISGMIMLGGLPGGLRVAAGDFRLRSGQGLLFGSARSFGKGSAVIEPALRGAWGIPDGLSSDEVNFFRGLAVSAGSGPVGGIVFGSMRAHSPSLSPDGSLRGIDESGYHRTTAELAARDRLTVRSAGGLLRLRAGDLVSVGAGLLVSSLEFREPGADRPPPPPASTVRWTADFRGSAGPVTLFGEAVISRIRTPWIAGALVEPSAGARILVVRRRYPPAGGLVRTFGFGDASTGENESGIYLAAEAPVASGVVASGYIDLYTGLAPSSGVPFPRAGVDRSISIRRDSRGFGVDARYRSRIVEVKRSPAAGEGPAAPGNGARRTDRLRLGVRWDAAEDLSCRFRIERSAVSPGTRGPVEGGVMGGAELTVRPLRGMTAHARMELFDAGSDASGFTSVEPDLPGTLTGTALAGEGSNWFLLLSYRISRHFSISVKFSRFTRDDVRRIGAGAGELPSNIREKAGIQLDLAW